MKTKDMLGGKFIKAAEDLMVNGKPAQMTLEISNVTKEEIGEELKYVLHFANYDKSLVLNRTNINTLLEIHPTEDTENWIGKLISIVAVETEYAGKRVWGTRISLTVPDKMPVPPEFTDTEA